MSMYDDVACEALHDWLDQRDELGELRREIAQLAVDDEIANEAEDLERERYAPPDPDARA